MECQCKSRLALDDRREKLEKQFEQAKAQTAYIQGQLTLVQELYDCTCDEDCNCATDTNTAKK